MFFTCSRSSKFKLLGCLICYTESKSAIYGLPKTNFQCDCVNKQEYQQSIQIPRPSTSRFSNTHRAWHILACSASATKSAHKSQKKCASATSFRRKVLALFFPWERTFLKGPEGNVDSTPSSMLMMFAEIRMLPTNQPTIHSTLLWQESLSGLGRSRVVGI